MLTQFRQEEIPKCKYLIINYNADLTIIFHLDFNQRHVLKFKTDLKPVQRVFKDWKEDGAETLGQITKHDWQRMIIDKLVDDEE